MGPGLVAVIHVEILGVRDKWALVWSPTLTSREIPADSCHLLPNTTGHHSLPYVEELLCFKNRTDI